MNCLYCSQEIKPVEQAYSFKEVKGRFEGWHYKCYLDRNVELIPLTLQTQRELSEFLLKVYGGHPEYPSFVKEVLMALGRTSASII